MKKLFIGIALFLPLSWAGATWFTSNQTESVFDQAIAHSNEDISENLPFIKIEKQSFEKGFTSSKAKSMLGLDPELFDTDEPVNVTLNHTIYHGPVMMTPNGVKSGSSYILTTLDQASLSPEAAEVFEKLFDGEEPFQIGMHTGVGDKVDVDMNIAGMHLDSEKLDFGPETAGAEEFLLTLDGITGQFSTNAEGTWLKGTMNLGALKILGKDDKNDINMQIDPSVVEMDFDEIYNGSMLTGSTDVKVPAFSMTNAADTVDMKGLSMRSSVEDNNGNLDALAVIDVEKVLVKAAKLPTDMPESSLHLSFGFKGMGREAFKQLIDASHDLSRSQNATLKAADNAQAVEDMMKAMGSYFEAFGNLLSQGAESNNVIRISGDKGSSELALDLTYTDSKKLFDLATVKDVIMALQGEMKLNIDKSMLTGLPVEQGMQMSMGLVQDTGDSYETVAVLDGGEVTVNGQPVPVLEMLGPMVDQPLPWQAMQGLTQ